MKPIEFKEQTKVLQKPKNMTDEGCGPLPIYNDGKMCVSCWKMSFKERVKAFLFGKMWVFIMSGKTQPPVGLVCNNTVFGEKAES